MADTGLQAAIDAAAAEITGKSGASGADEGKTEETVETAETQVEEETEETSEESSESEEFTAAQLEEAKNIYKALLDPEQAPRLIGALAAQTGLLTNIGEANKTEVKEVKKDLTKILEEELGDAYKFLAPHLGKALDKILAQEREIQQQNVAELQTNQTLNEVEKTLTAIAKETNGTSRKLENKMADLMKEYPIGQSGNVDKYIRDIYTLASAGKVRSNTQQVIADKVRRNANNVSDRIGQKGGQPGADALPSDKKLSLKESVDWALSQMAGKK